MRSFDGMKKILFLDTVHEILQKRLEKAGFLCERHLSAFREEILEMAKNYQGVVLRSRITIDKAFLDAAPNLEFIARSGSGLENIDVEEAKARGIAVINSPEGNRDAVGEHAVGMILMLMNQLKKADHEVRDGHWNRESNRGYELKKKTIGIIGYGVMGSGFAEKLKGFGCRIFAHDKYKTGFEKSGVKEVSLENIYEEADIVSLHLPLTPETKYYVNDTFIAQFKKNIYLINTARGKNVETASVVRGLRSGKILGACLDVLEYEKASLEDLDERPADLLYLMQSDKVILTPHIAGWTHESYFKLSDVLANKILAFYQKK